MIPDMIYLDNAATTWPKPESVSEAISNAINRCGGNPGRGGHRLALAAGELLYEVREQKAPYWFNNTEVARLQQLNQEYTQQKDLTQMVQACFRRPKDGEAATAMTSTQMLEMIRKEYPSVPCKHSMKIQLGFALKELGFERHERGGIAYYKTVPLIAA